MKNGAKIAIVIIIVAIAVFMVGAMTSNNNHTNIKNITTPYNTTAKIDIGKGMYTEDTHVNENGQVLAFDAGGNEGYFISTSKENAADFIKSIQSGTKCRDGDIVYYHLEDKELVNTYSPFGGTHLKLKTTNSVNVGFMENPNSDEVIIVMAGPDTIVDCFKSIEWGK
ncbi:MAG: hypothetical protein J6S29_01035 [Methanosphaera sp.]|nr:hypothetical protein [Methanosphaera sp.]